MEAMGEMEILKLLTKFDFTGKLPRAIHERCLELFYEYTLIGGMPEAVKVYAEERAQAAVNQSL